jgi:ATP-dependent 26S proteasome regulatory subunit
METIINAYNSSEIRSSLKVMLYGDPGIGKSSIGKFLARHMNSTYVDEYVPTDAGDKFMYLYREHKSLSRLTPLIVVVNEFDKIVEESFDTTTLDGGYNKTLPTDIYNKMSYNNFMDRVEFLENIILIFTTNKTPEWFTTIDTCITRAGRVNMILSVG